MTTQRALLGIDLGTSSVKASLFDLEGDLLGSGMREYPILTPEPGYAEHDPEAWWRATCEAIQEATNIASQHTGHANGLPDVIGIGLSGHMHGFALVNAEGHSVGNAIIWPDQRSSVQVQIMRDRIGAEKLARIAGTAPATGFMGPTLLWLAEHDPDRLSRAAACLLPKDYIRLRLTGNIGTEASDASATGIFDVTRRVWSDEIVDVLNLPRRLLPAVNNSTDVIGHVTAAAATVIGLPAGIPVVAGGADQTAQAIGNGLITPGAGSVTLGTGGQMIILLDSVRVDEGLRLHTFCHALPDRWYMLGAMLSAGMSLRWLRDTVGLTSDPSAYDRLSAEAQAVPLGADGLIFLPYLVGERSPLMDSSARAAFVGLTLRHTRGHMARAIMEGVAFALRHILETMREAGADVQELLAAGNGLANPFWRGVTADVLGIPLLSANAGERASRGAALLAGLGVGALSMDDILRITREDHPRTLPDLARHDRYTKLYAEFRRAYPALRSFS